MDSFNTGGGGLDLSTLAFQAMAIRYSAVANLAIWLYEFLLTIDAEIRLVWPSRFTIIKLLYIANRYLPLLVTSANAYFLILNDSKDAYLCKPALLIVGYISFTGFFLAEAVLVLRVYVIWQARKSILFIVVGILFAKTGASCVITYFYLTSAYMSPINIFRSGCECVFTKRIEWITMLFVFLFEIVILSLMITAKRAHLRRNRSELVDILVKDGVLYCICIMAISLANVFIVKFAPTVVSPFLIVTQGMLHNILCTRLLLRLRDTNARRSSVLVQHCDLPMSVQMRMKMKTKMEMGMEMEPVGSVSGSRSSSS